MQKTKWFLQIFAEGAAPGDSGAGESAAPAPATPKGRKANPEADTLFGIQPEETPPATAQEASSPPETEEKARVSLDEMLKNDPELKKEYDSKVRKSIDDRFRGQKAAKQRQEHMERILAQTARRYKLPQDGELDLEAIEKAMQNDNAYYQQRAMENGTTEEMERMAEENATLKKQQEQNVIQQQEEARQEQARQEFQKIVQQAEALRQTYPTFDLNVEMNNREFARLIGSGVPVKTAYEVMHKDEIMHAGMQYAVQETSKRLANAVQTNAQRPTEGVLGSNSAAKHVTDPKNLTKAQREEIKARVRRGERIVW